MYAFAMALAQVEGDAKVVCCKVSHATVQHMSLVAPSRMQLEDMGLTPKPFCVTRIAL